MLRKHESIVLKQTDVSRHSLSQSTSMLVITWCLSLAILDTSASTVVISDVEASSLQSLVALLTQRAVCQF